jgi:hypothetical protein
MNADTTRQVTTRNDIARDIVAGFAAVTPTLAGVFRLIDTALADVPAVLAEVRQGRADLEAARLEAANLLAAMRAAIAAHADGEADPLYYLRDEVEAAQARSAGRGAAS